MVHQDATHQLCGRGEKVSPALALDFPLPREPHVGFVYQCRGLERVVGPLASQAVPRPAAQLFED
jgi:hypothetical protein